MFEMYLILFLFGLCVLALVAAIVYETAVAIAGTIGLIKFSFCFLDSLCDVVEGAIKRTIKLIWKAVKLIWTWVLRPALSLIYRAALSASDSIFSAAEECASCWEGHVASFLGAAEGFTLLRFGDAPYWWFRPLSALFFTATVSLFILVIGYMTSGWGGTPPSA